MATGRVNVGGGGAKLNVFTQMTEPSTKEGIWIQSDVPHKKVVNDTELYFQNSWIDPDLDLIARSPYNATYMNTTTVIGKYIYVIFSQYLTSGSGENNLYKYDTVLNVWSFVSKPPFASNGTTIESKGDVIYAMGGFFGSVQYVFHKYDTITDTWTKLSNPIRAYVNSPFSIVGEYGYSLGGNTSYGGGVSNLCYKYSIADDVWTQLSNVPGTSVSPSQQSIVVEDKIYVRYQGYQIRIYDTVTGLWTALTTNSSIINHAGGALVKVGGYVYNLGGYSDKVGIIDTINNNSLSLGVPLPDLYAVSGPRVVNGEFVNGRIYLIGGMYKYGSSQPSTDKSIAFSFKSKQFKDLTAVLFKSDENRGTYYTELVSPLKGLTGMEPFRITSGFNGAWIFKDGNLQELPSYYGNGTNWIKFKN